MFERDDKTARVFIDAHGYDEAALREGLRWLVVFAEKSGSSSAAIALGVLRQIEWRDDILKLWREEAASA